MTNSLLIRCVSHQRKAVSIKQRCTYKTTERYKDTGGDRATGKGVVLHQYRWNKVAIFGRSGPTIEMPIGTL